jgi:hypothetical protein
MSEVRCHRCDRILAGSVSIRTPHDQLAKEAAEWSSGVRKPEGWQDAPEALPLKKHAPVCWQPCTPIDWRARALAAEKACFEIRKVNQLHSCTPAFIYEKASTESLIIAERVLEDVLAARRK